MIESNFNPKVSIIIPVYNGANYMRDAIDSALGQTYKNIEVIVVNDGSTDEGQTDKIARSYGNKIRYFHKKNGGVATALNLGISKMTGEYFSWLSHDDVYYPNKIETQISFLRKLENKCVGLYSDYEFIDRDSNFLSEKRIVGTDPDKMKFALISSYPIHGCDVLLPKKIFDEIGLFDEKLKTTQDYDMWYRVADKFDFIHQREILIKSRLHAEQGVETVESNTEEMCDFYYRCLQSIPSDKMLLISGNKSVSNVYANLAIKYKRRIVSKASLLSSTLAKQHLFKDGILTIVMNILLIGYCDIMNTAFRLLNAMGFKKAPKRQFSERLKLVKKL